MIFFFFFKNLENEESSWLLFIIIFKIIYKYYIFNFPDIKKVIGIYFLYKKKMFVVNENFA